MSGAPDITSFDTDVSPFASDTVNSFLRFVGKEPFAKTDEFHALMRDLERENIQWISSLKETTTGIWPLQELVAGMRCLTMGPLEGALEFHLSRFGAAEIIAIEGSRANYQKCQVLKAAFPNLPLTLVNGDVLEVEFPHGIDAIFCPGVLYHVDAPHTLLEKIRAAEPRLTFINTQLGVPPSHPASVYRQLSEESSIVYKGETYKGRLFGEGRSDYLSGLDKNRPSLWLYPDDLLRLLRAVGFQVLDEFVVDVGQLGVCGSYVCAVPRADGRTPRFHIGLFMRIARRLFAMAARRMSAREILDRSNFRG
jgi:hypothetical protein